MFLFQISFLQPNVIIDLVTVLYVQEMVISHLLIVMGRVVFSLCVIYIYRSCVYNTDFYSIFAVLNLLLLLLHHIVFILDIGTIIKFCH